MEKKFYKRAILGSTNYDCGTPIIDYLHGYLNYQIEHHLFPNMSNIHYPVIAPIVQKYCLENNIDPLGRDYAKYEIVEVDDNYPKYIINNKEKFDYLIKK